MAEEYIKEKKVWLLHVVRKQTPNWRAKRRASADRY